MPRPWSRSLFSLVAALAALPSACKSRQPDRETASATVTDTVAGTWEKHTGAVPVTSASEEARRLYLEGRALSEQLRLHDGRALYEQAAKADPSFALAHYQLAVNAATAKDFFAHLKEAVALADKVSEGERLMIQAAEAGGNATPARALALQQELVAKYPGDERAHFLLGGAYFGRQEYDKAIEEYRTATELNPGFSPAYNLLGYAYRQIERYDDAEAAFRKYIELIPGDPNPYDSYAELLMKMGRFDESLAQYRKALEVNRHFTPSRVGIANNLMLQGRHDAAAAEMDALHGAARDDADRRTALFVKGVILVDAGRTDAAIREIEREYALDARLADSANMSGDALMLCNMLIQRRPYGRGGHAIPAGIGPDRAVEPVGRREAGRSVGRPLEPWQRRARLRRSHDRQVRVGGVCRRGPVAPEPVPAPAGPPARGRHRVEGAPV